MKRRARLARGRGGNGRGASAGAAARRARREQSVQSLSPRRVENWLKREATGRTKNTRASDEDEAALEPKIQGQDGERPRRARGGSR